MQVKVSLHHHASASVVLQGVLIDSAVFVADGVDYLVAALYRKDNNNNNGNLPLPSPLTPYCLHYRGYL